MSATSPGIFVTGTDTGVGKTVVCVALVHALVKLGLRVAVMKPVASGAHPTPAGLRNADALALAGASNVAVAYERINPYCFEPAISPHIAADEAGIAINLDTIADEFAGLAAGADFTVVEGAGGWLAPISGTHTMADLAYRLELPVLVVVGLRLGCLNHAALTKFALDARRAPFAGWLANCVDGQLERPTENLAALEIRLGRPPLAVLPFASDCDHHRASGGKPVLTPKAAKALLAATGSARSFQS